MEKDYHRFIGIFVLLIWIVPKGLAVEKSDVTFIRSGLRGLEKVSLSGEAMRLLQQNGFVITPGYEDEIFDIYSDSKKRSQPIFVTTDAVLHTAHIFFGYLLRILETEKFYGLTNELTDRMLTLSIKQYNEALDRTSWARR